ncbi:hypothetical protein LCGC14_2687800 [marine sediment metagenome]|uniref:Methyltransferase domain-containing protein n=1 Tax=marine sediment metagenome TaxID=412755 RepID=A0A0F9A6Y3_9ZZZZ
MKNVTEISQLLRSLRNRITHELDASDIDEMGLPSYLDGSWLSRRMAWGKLDVLITLASFQPEDVVLDFGCGTGILLALINKRVKKVFATDINPRMAKLVVRELGIANVEFLPVEAVPQLPSGEVTKIVAANVLEHVPDLQRVITDFGKIMAPTSRLIVSGPTENLLYRFGRWTVGFSGDYHVRGIDDIFAEVGSSEDLVLQSQRAFPLPGPFCLYRIASFLPSGG